MAKDSFRVKKGVLNIEPNQPSSSDEKGDIRVKNSGRLEVHDGTSYHEIVDLDSVQTLTNKTVTGAGNASGPASSTDESIARFDGTTGKLLQDSGSVTISDANVFSGASQINVDSIRLDGTTISNPGVGNINLVTTNGDVFLQGGTGGVVNINGVVFNTPNIIASSDSIQAGNLNLANNNLTSTNTNGNLNLTPNGTGKIVSSKSHVFSTTYETTGQVDSTTTGSNQNLAPTGSFIKVTNGSLTSVRSISQGANGQQLKITNGTGVNVTLKNQDAGATAAARIITGTGSDMSLAPDQSVELVYDVDSLRWRVVGGTGSASSINSYVELYSATGTGGHGSTFTNRRTFINSTTVGSDITYTSDTTNGDYFTINANGVYSIYWMDRASGGVQPFSFVRNQTVNQDGSSEVPPILIAFNNFPTQGGLVAVTLGLTSGDVIHMTDNGQANNTTSSICRITRVS